MDPCFAGSFDVVATAADGDGSCISEQDFHAYYGAGWNDLPAEYTRDGCIDEGEWNTIVSGGPSGDQGLGRQTRACCWHMRAASDSARHCRSMLLPLCTHSSMYMHFAPPLPSRPPSAAVSPNCGWSSGVSTTSCALVTALTVARIPWKHRVSIACGT